MLAQSRRKAAPWWGPFGKFLARAVWCSLAIAVLACGCPASAQDRFGDECDDNLKSDTLQEYARKCAEAVGEDVPSFDCDAGTSVPETHLTGSGYGSQMCDEPNVLNGQCDPGSRFQVLKQTKDVEIVGHCRKKGLGAHVYGDVAVIQYNQKNGAMCFYQALENDLPNKVTAPSQGNGSGKFPWLDPVTTAGIHCAQCHDNGPFIRSEYLAQLRNEPKNRLPGTNPDPNGRWDQRFSWNSTLPYSFIGNDFQTWKTFSVTMTGTGSGCMGCHRLAFSAHDGSAQSLVGTAQNFAKIATDPAQMSKNPHSVDSPIWMTPGQNTYSAANSAEAHAVQACAAALVAKANDPTAPDPPSGCQAVQFGRGNTCRSGPITVVVNGATQSDPSTHRTDVVTPLGSCPASGPCPPGLCYWKTVHGPFWQKSPSTVHFGASNYRGSFVRIFSKAGMWTSEAFSDPTGGPAMPPPGGTIECTNYNEIKAVPDTGQCFADPFSVADKDGTNLTGSTDATIAGDKTIDTLSGLIGNVAQANVGDGGRESDFMRVHEDAGKVSLFYRHTKGPPSPLKVGPLIGQSWTNGCNNYAADYIVRDKFTSTDTQLVDAAQAKNARCYVSGVTGAWSSTSNNGNSQPFAQIYVGSGQDIRLRVSPTSGAKEAGAYASCFKLK